MTGPSPIGQNSPSSLATGTGAQRVRQFLETMQKRDLAQAKKFLAPEFQMVFPGGKTMTQLEELVAWGAQRYRSIGKTYQRFDELASSVEGQTSQTSIVYCYGHLFGVWLDGDSFEGIRFVDRFEIRDGLFVRQDVWNDLGEVQKTG